MSLGDCYCLYVAPLQVQDFLHVYGNVGPLEPAD